jgi:hypothetical protein
MSLTISGHVNRVITYADNGFTSGITHNTNAFSQSRVRWIGNGKINDDLSVQTYIEMGNNTSMSNSGGQGTDDRGDVNGNALTDRFIEIRLTSKSLGKLYIGQGSTATDGTSEVDLSGTGIISLNGLGELVGGSEPIRNSTTGAIVTTVANVFNNFDGDSRLNRLRYDTPTFAGFGLAASHGNGDRSAIALRYGGDIGGVKVKAAVGYTGQGLNSGTHDERYNGSASILFPFGLSLTGGAAHRAARATSVDGDWWYGKIGYKFKGFELGETRLYADYSRNDDIQADNDEATYIGVGVVQIVEPLGAEVYLNYRNFDLDRPGTATDDVDTVSVGMRVSF